VARKREERESVDERAAAAAHKIREDAREAQIAAAALTRAHTHSSVKEIRLYNRGARRFLGNHLYIRNSGESIRRVHDAARRSPFRFTKISWTRTRGRLAIHHPSVKGSRNLSLRRTTTRRIFLRNTVCVRARTPRHKARERYRTERRSTECESTVQSDVCGARLQERRR
jgi:hypothetical protein